MKPTTAPELNVNGSGASVEAPAHQGREYARLGAKHVNGHQHAGVECVEMGDMGEGSGVGLLICCLYAALPSES